MAMATPVPPSKPKKKPKADQAVTPPVEQIDNPVNVTTTGDVQTTAVVVDTQNVAQAIVPPNQLVIETASPMQAVKVNMQAC